MLMVNFELIIPEAEEETDNTRSTGGFFGITVKKEEKKQIKK